MRGESDMSEEFDLDEVLSRIEDAVENAVTDQIEDAVNGALQDFLPETLEECFADFEFVLLNGTIVRPRRHMKVLSPDKTKLLLCYGGLRVDGCSLVVQTRISCWEAIAVYQSREEAAQALVRVKNAMDAGVETLEL